MPRPIKSPQIGRVNDIPFHELDQVIKLSKAWNKNMGQYILFLNIKFNFKYEEKYL